MKPVIKFSIICLLFSSFSTMGAETIRLNKVEGEKELLMFDILKLVMSKVDSDTKYIESDEALSTSRVINKLETKELDIMWGGTSPEREAQFMTVRIPALKGLLGHRIFIIRAADQNTFNNVQSLADLKKLKAGQGTLWGDTKVLKNANISTVTTLKYPNLFLMLEGERFDYFPRAVHEPWVEVSSRPELNLAIEKNIMLIYPFALHFFVEKSNTRLHDQIYKGFNQAIADGSFNKLFFNHPMIKNALEKANLSQRKVFRIDNPYMSPDTPYDRPEYWLDIKNIDNDLKNTQRINLRPLHEVASKAKKR